MAPLRRVVIGRNANGRSAVQFDGPTSNTIEPIPGLIFSDFWETQAPPSDNDDPADAGDRPIRLEPGPGGAIFKAVTFPPANSFDEAQWAEVYALIGASAGSNEGGAMHVTRTIDYVIVVEGEIWCVLDEGEVLLRQGDVVVQRGTNHAWRNRSDRQATLVGIMMDNR